MAYYRGRGYRRRRFPGVRGNRWKRGYHFTRIFAYGAGRKVYRRGRRSFLSLRPMHRNMLAGAVIMLVVFLMMPKARNWLLTTWFKLGLPAPKGGA